MKRLMIGLLGAFAFAAVAQTPGQSAQGATAQEASAQTAQDEAKKDPVSERTCLRQTGTRIKTRANAKDRGCLAANGRVYSRDDINRTGEVDIADALRKLDPSIH